MPRKSEQHTSKMMVAMNEAHLALTKVADDMAQFYDVHWKEASLYKIRDKVWLMDRISPQAS